MSPAGGCEWASCAAGVCSEWCRQSEASWFLPGVQSDRTQHHCLQGGRHRGHHCYWDPSGAQQWHDTCVRGCLCMDNTLFVDTYTVLKKFIVCCFIFPNLLCFYSVDCVGILKLRNADVEARIGVAGSKKKSTRARLAFRVNIPQPDGSVLTLQVPSSPILCSE